MAPVLNGVQRLAGPRECFDRLDGVAGSLGGQQRAGNHRLAVEQHSARAALARLAAVLDAETSLAPQHVQQPFAGASHPGDGLPV
jgi:hypothetical protein